MNIEITDRAKKEIANILKNEEKGSFFFVLPLKAEVVLDLNIFFLSTKLSILMTSKMIW